MAASELQLRCGLQLAKRFDSAGIPYVFLKGSAARLLGYSPAELRGSLDVDIGLSPKDLRAGEALAMADGFIPAQWDFDLDDFTLADSEIRRATEANHYELGVLVKRLQPRIAPGLAKVIRESLPMLGTWHLAPDGELACYINIDLHGGLEIDLPVDRCLFTSQLLNFRGYNCRVPSLPWLVFHILGKLYMEAVDQYGVGGHQYADIARLAPQMNDDDATEFLALCDERCLKFAAYYVLRRLTPTFGVFLCTRLEEFVTCPPVPARHATPFDQRDFGDVWERVWSGAAP